MSSKVYIASRTSSLPDAKNFSSWLERNGFEIAYKWWDAPKFPKPYRGSKDPELQQVMRTALSSAVAADVFVLFSGPGIRGAYIELGAFLADADAQSKTVYVIGGANEEHSFESLSHFIFADSVEHLKREFLNA